jgi:glycerol dehydrogenase
LNKEKNMANIIGSPSRYIQGKGELANIAAYAANLGRKKIFALVSKSGKGRVENTLLESAKKTGSTVNFEIFNGECSANEINRILASFKASDSDIIAGIGGGKILDTAKAVAEDAGIPILIAPTIASTDAPCSALSVVYTDDGVFEKYRFLHQNPNIVLVDTGIVAAAPVRLLVSGMGDALATYFEARSCRQKDADNCVGGKTTLTAQAIARLCYDTLICDGKKAATALERGGCTKAVENIIEANTYLSGIGFESGGLAAAHAVHNGLTALHETHVFYHGEKVAFGTIVHLVLENAPSRELEEVLKFCTDVGLPVTLGDLNVKNPSGAALREAAEKTAAPGETIHNMPFTVTPETVYDAILGADAIGTRWKASLCK